MSLDNNNEYTQNDLYEQRRKKAENFHLHISDDDYGFDTLPSETDELNSYSGEQAREEIARKSKPHSKKLKKRRKRNLSKRINTTDVISEYFGLFPLLLSALCCLFILSRV